MSHPLAMMGSMNNAAPRCVHRPTEVTGVSVVSCPSCGTVEWWGEGRALDPADGLNRLFGQFDLVGRLPAVGAPAPEVLVYRPPNRKAKARLGAFPAGAWMEAAPGLWLSHDGRTLLLAPVDPLLIANLSRS